MRFVASLAVAASKRGAGCAIRVSTRPSTLECRVGPAGNVDLLQADQVHVAGTTIEQATDAIVDTLTKSLGVHEVKVEVSAANSKRVYVIAENPSGRIVTAIKHTGSLTVSEALARVAPKPIEIGQVYMVFPYRNRVSDRLELDVDVLFSKDDEEANHPLIPGDRLFFVTKGGPEEN